MANMNPEVSIVVESYNFGEGSGLDRLSLALDHAVRMANEYGNTEVVLVETTGDASVLHLLEETYPRIHMIDAVGLHYDVAKMKASAAAKGDFILFLDGDVIPGDGWMDAHLRTLRMDGVVATTGFTTYDGGYFGKLCTVMDFGFLLPPRAESVGCYAFNNTGFRKGLLEEVPPRRTDAVLLLRPCPDPRAQRNPRADGSRCPQHARAAPVLRGAVPPGIRPSRFVVGESRTPRGRASQERAASRSRLLPASGASRSPKTACSMARAGAN